MQYPTNLKEIVIGVSGYLVLSVALILSGGPVVGTLLIVLFIFCLAGLGLTLGWGVAVRRAREFANDAMDRALKSDFKRARELALLATRADRSLLRVPAMHRLYELIQTRDTSADASLEIRRMKEEIKDWPKTKVTAVFLTPQFGLFAGISVIAFFILRLLELRF